MPESPASTSAAPGKSLPEKGLVPRLMSVDALRGFDMFWIICAEELVAALHKMSPNWLVNFVSTQLDHVEWEGVHFEDLIFPLFVFIMGVSSVFSLTKIIAREGRAAAIGRVVRRSVLMFVLGLIFYGGLSNHWPHMRLMGVLNRIALCYFFGGLAFCLLKPRALVGLAAGLLLGYWALMAWVPFPDVRPTPGGDSVITKENHPDKSTLNLASTTMIHGTYIQGVNLANYVDQKYLPGKPWDGTYDPEGILSTIPAVVTCLLGIFAGLFLMSENFCHTRKAAYLIGGGGALVLLGLLWGLEFPIIKKIWTSSYVLVAGGYSAIMLGVFYWVVDVMHFQWWCQPFVWMGMNSITIYVVSHLLDGFLGLSSRLVGGDVMDFFNARVQGLGDLLVAIVAMVLVFWFLNYLYRKKVFLRL